MSTQTNEFTLGSLTSLSGRQLRIVSPILSLCTIGSKYPKSHLFCNNNGFLEWRKKKVVHSIFLPLAGMWLPESITAFVWWYIVRWSTLYCRNWREMEDSFKLHVTAQIIMHNITSIGIRWTYLLSSVLPSTNSKSNNACGALSVNFAQKSVLND